MTRSALSVLAAGATLFAVGALFHVVAPVVAPGLADHYADAGLFRPWGGWTSTYMLAHPFAFAVPFALGHRLLRRGVPPGWRGGAGYGAGVFLVGALPVYLLVFASFRVPAEVVASWAAQAACQYAAAGAAVGVIASGRLGSSQPRA